MSNLPPLPVLCDTPPPIDDFESAEDDFGEFEASYDFGKIEKNQLIFFFIRATFNIIIFLYLYIPDVIGEPSKPMSFSLKTPDDVEPEEIIVTEPDLPYLGARLPPDGTDFTLDFPDDTHRELDLDSPPSLNFSSNSEIESKIVDEQLLDPEEAPMTNNENVTVASLHIPSENKENNEKCANLQLSETSSEKLDFTSTSMETNEDQKEIQNDFDDFTAFESRTPPDKLNTVIDVFSAHVWDDASSKDDSAFEANFGDFALDFSSNQSPIKSTDLPTESKATPNEFGSNIQSYEDEDDFGDFNDFQQSEINVDISANLISHSEPNINTEFQLPTITIEKLNEIFSCIYPAISQESLDYRDQKATFDVVPFDDCIILKRLKDIESSCSLSYKFQNSITNTTLMDSIGIDSKNTVSVPMFFNFFYYNYIF